MKPYPAYKPTDLDGFFVSVPKHWDVLSIKRLSRVLRGASPRPIADPKYFDDDGEYAWTLIADVSASNMYLKKTKQKLSELGASLSVKLEPGDIFLSIAGSVGKPIIADIKCCIHDGFVYFPFLNGKIDTKYLYYIFNIGLFFDGLGKLGTQLNLNTETVGNIKIPVPPLDEQERIVKYLGAKHREIERYIAAKRKLLLRLGELSAATISRAVTRGLNADVALKPSGVEWLGDVPQHWDVKRLKFVVDYVSRGNTPTYAVESDIRVINQACVYPDGLRLEKCKFQSPENADGIESWKGFLKQNDVLINSTGTGTLGRVTLFEEAEGTYFADGHVTIARDSKGRINPRYLVRMLSILQDWITSEASVGATNQIELVRGKFQNLLIPVPPLAEQTAIVAYLESQLAIIGEARGRIEREIELARELYQTLVANVVTGQVDVSGIEVEDDKSQFVDELSEVDDELSDVADELSNVDDELSEVEDDG